MIRGVSAGCVIVAALAMNGCWFKRKPQAQPPPPAPTQVPRAAQQSPPPATAKKPPAKRKQPSSTPRAAQPAAPPRTTEVKKEAPPVTPEAPQQFGKILSPEEQSRYRAMYEKSVSAAEEMLVRLASGEGAADRSASIGRIRSFLEQARESSTSDWSTAAQLAYRAEVLARDLMRLLP